MDRKQELLEKILHLYDEMGDLHYDGEPVTQLEHAWQSYKLAKEADKTTALQCAAFLHNYGHLLSKRKDTPTLEGYDDRHEIMGANVLSKNFPTSITEPIRLHVSAKRYLVSTDALYYECLSADSRRSLVLQGGKMNAEEIEVFLQNPYALEAIDLRRFDDAAKINIRLENRAEALATLKMLCESCAHE